MSQFDTILLNLQRSQMSSIDSIHFSIVAETHKNQATWLKSTHQP